MITEIRKKIDQELARYIQQLKSKYSLDNISPVLFKYIKEFLLREGKRLRPTLCVMAYLGYTQRQKPGLYATALSLELLHDFMLIHDDIIDKSDTRRRRPSMHAMLNTHLSNYRNPKFNGQDLAIIVGDVVYAMALDAFLSIKEKSARKEKASKKLIEAALYTGSGEFVELLTGLKSLNDISKNEIYKIYDLKTARYTFSYPLAIGAILAGANEKEVARLMRWGLYVGRAFQIQDDILGMFREEIETGKSNLTDLREGKKTLLMLIAYKNSDNINKRLIRKILSKRNARLADLEKMRRIIINSGARQKIKKEMSSCLKTAQSLLSLSCMKPRYKNMLNDYVKQIIKT